MFKLSQIDPPSLELDGRTYDDTESENTMCLGNARRISGTVTKIVDGDTIQVDDEIIRFALVDAPKINMTVVNPWALLNKSVPWVQQP